MQTVEDRGGLHAAVKHQSESEHAKGEIGGQNAEYSQLHGWPSVDFAFSLDSGEPSACPKLAAQLQTARRVHLENLCCGSPSRCSAHDKGKLPKEMIDPGLLAWIEEAHYLARISVNTSQIRSLVPVASVAGITEVLDIVIAAMLLWDDVLDMEYGGNELFRETAIFATETSTLSYKRSNFGIHQTSGESRSACRALA
jgi:hypothetical protein